MHWRRTNFSALRECGRRLSAPTGFAIYHALSGLRCLGDRIPRALPWAGLSHPFGVAWRIWRDLCRCQWTGLNVRNEVGARRRLPHSLPVVLGALLWLGVHPVHAGNDEDFRAGNKLYDEGKFTEAVALYEKIEPRTAHVYFNLGNVYFRNGQLGKAILSYERARRLSPSDPDILANLKFAQERAGVDAVNTPSKALSRFAATVFFSRTLDGWSVALVVAVWLTSLAVAAATWVRPARTIFAWVAAVLFVWLAFTCVALAYRTTRERAAPSAVVTVKLAEARFAPLADATVHFKLAVGSKVAIRENRGEWLFVERMDGQQGWARKETVESVGVQ